MNPSNQDDYLKQLDRILDPTLWNPQNAPVEEGKIDKRLSKYAQKIFQDHPTFSPERSLIEFVKLGIKNGWIDKGTIGKLHTLAIRAEIISQPESELGSIIEQAFQSKLEDMVSNGDMGGIINWLETGAIIPEFLQRFVDVNKKWKDGETLLNRAVMVSQLNAVEALIRAGADVNEPDILDVTPLMSAVKEKNAECVKMLLDAGAKVDDVNKQGENPLWLAALKGDADCVELFIDAGINIDHKLINGQSLLKFAAWRGMTDMVKMLIRKGADCYELNDGLDLVNTIKAARRPHYKQIQQLLQAVPGFTDFSKEIRYRKYLSHFAEINARAPLMSKDSFEVHPGLMNYSGIFPERMFSKMAKSIRQFSENHSHMISGEFADLFSKAVELCSGPDPNASDLYDQWKSGQPVILTSGFKGHSTTTLLWGDKFVLCNRGVLLQRNTYWMYTFDSDKLTPFTIKKIKKRHVHFDESDNLFFNELPRELAFQQTEIKRYLELPLIKPQKIGNCAYASIEGMALILLVLSKLNEAKASVGQLDPEIIQQVAEEQQMAFSQWQAHQLMQTLKKYLAWARNRTNHFIPHIGLINRIFADKQNMLKLEPEMQDEWNRLRTQWERESQRHLTDLSLGQAFYYFGFQGLASTIGGRLTALDFNTRHHYRS